ncbi:MAG: threonine synthase [Kiloniellales bacterium]|nr:threonine synthase [Kiloniellales bacterium]
MDYISTRGQAPALPFDEVLLTGLARDGGLYLPSAWPRFSPDEVRGFARLSYPELAGRVLAPFVSGVIPEPRFAEILEEAYAGFGHAAVAPLKQLGRRLWLLELFHGPTLAFKDYALQVVGRLFDEVLGARSRNHRITIIGATSGDTGSAAIEACRDRERVEIFILHPQGRVTEVQRRQMTTVEAPNVHNLAIEGSFDDCQDLVKAMFNDPDFREETALAGVNSINCARILGQIVYYFAAAAALGAPARRLSFAVPTGNFGNVYAGYAARQMGLPIERLIVASNVNDILTRFFESGAMVIDEVRATYSPSMDIQISSNFERLLYDLLGQDGRAVAETMTRFRASGRFELDRAAWQASLELFTGFRLDEAGTLAAIERIHRTTGELLDPHSAIGVAAAEARLDGLEGPVVALATAHPAKFPDAVETASGVRPQLPPRLADLYDREERLQVLPNDLAAVQEAIRRTRDLRGAA